MAEDQSEGIKPEPDPNAPNKEQKNKTKPIDMSAVSGKISSSPAGRNINADPALPNLMAEVKKQTSRVPLAKSETDLIKRSTTRIDDLSSGSPSPIPQTIRLKRPASVTQQVRAGLGQAQARQATDRIKLSEAPTIARQSPLKRQTSRIILSETPPPAGLPSPSEIRRAPTEAIPETIRLKRPSVTLGEETALEPVTSEQVETAKKSETAKIDLEAESVAPVPITQRKTIKIKRTERNVMPRTVTLARPKGAPPLPIPGAKQAIAEETGDEDEAGVFFSVLAAAAVLVVGALAYIMAAQIWPELALPLPSIMSL
jgi:hypothetical protein